MSVSYGQAYYIGTKKNHNRSLNEYFLTLDISSTPLRFETGLRKCPENGQHAAATVWSGINSKRKSNQRVAIGIKDHSSTYHIGPHNKHIHSHHEVKKLGFRLGCLIQRLLTKHPITKVLFFSALGLDGATFGEVKVLQPEKIATYISKYLAPGHRMFCSG